MAWPISPAGVTPPPFTSKRGLHVIYNVTAAGPFTGKRGLHIVYNVGRYPPFTGKRGLHIVYNILPPEKSGTPFQVILI